MKLIPSEPDVETLVRRIENGDIDLQPDFQRKEVWSRAKKRKLIDTILRDWSIPPVHLVKTINGALEVLDGQQRLSAMRDFFANEFSIDGKIEPIDSEIRYLHGLFFRDLDKSTRRRIQNFPIRCFTLTDYNPDEPSELFYRLNEPTMLTSGERRNALYGEARDQLKSLVHYMVDIGLAKATLGFSNSRLSYDDVIARLLVFLEEQSLSEKSTENRVAERFRKGQPFEEALINAVKDALRAFSEAKAQAPFIRLNKASLLSWLVFSVHESIKPNLPDFFAKFYAERDRDGSDYYVEEAKAVFLDRSRLRVSDVSSVLFRDFCLWYVYYYYYNDFASDIKYRIELIREVYNDVNQRDDVTFEYSLLQRVTPKGWGELN